MKGALNYAVWGRYPSERSLVPPGSAFAQLSRWFPMIKFSALPSHGGPDSKVADQRNGRNENELPGSRGWEARLLVRRADLAVALALVLV